MRFLVRLMLFLMEIILPSGLKPCVRSYLKGRKLWLYVSGDRSIPE